MKKSLLILITTLAFAPTSLSFAAATSDMATKKTELKTQRNLACNAPADKHKKECLLPSVNSQQSVQH